MNEKIQKVMARAGFASRREIETWIQNGRIKVNQKKAKIGDRISGSDKLFLDGKPISTGPKETLKTDIIALYKPVGCICTRQDRQNRPTVFANLPRLAFGRWISIGRLDINTSGLLLFTNNGDLANKLMHPRLKVKREYLVRARGNLNQNTFNKLKMGVLLSDGPAKVDYIKCVGRKDGINHWYRITVTEGRNRLIRRLMESQKIEVNRLLRISYGSVSLAKYRKPGELWRLSDHKIQKLVAQTN